MVIPFCEQILERIDFEHAFGEQALEACVLLLQFPEALDLGDRHATVGFAPAIEGGLGATLLTADVADGLRPVIRLRQDADDLFGRVLIGLHSGPPSGGLYHSYLSRFLGASHDQQVEIAAGLCLTAGRQALDALQ